MVWYVPYDHTIAPKPCQSHPVQHWKMPKQPREENETNSDPAVNDLQAALEAQDWRDLQDIARDAVVVEFDAVTGRPVCPSVLPTDRALDGLVVWRQLPLSLLQKLQQIHGTIQQHVAKDNMVPWAGLGGDSTRLRAFGFTVDSLKRLDQSAIRLHAPEKEGADAAADEVANRQAICTLDEDLVRDATRDVCRLLAPAGLDPTIFDPSQIVAYQINLHNGAPHLAAHLDFPLHEGFGQIIMTVALKSAATILLIGQAVSDDEDQPAWRFHLNQGDAYVLSDRARNQCLHAVLGDAHRESLNLRFGLHTPQQAQEQILKHWPEDV